MRWPVLAAAVAACGWTTGGIASGEPDVGTVAPDFSTKEIVSGHTMRLSEQRGKVVFLTFWATWCEPCREELPVLHNVQKRLGDGRAVVYAISFHERASERDLVKMAHKGGLLVTLLEDPRNKIADQYGIRAIPHLFIIGRDGKILSINTGFGKGSIEELVAEINSALRQDASAAD